MNNSSHMMKIPSSQLEHKINDFVNFLMDAVIIGDFDSISRYEQKLCYYVDTNFPHAKKALMNFFDNINDIIISGKIQSFEKQLEIELDDFWCAFDNGFYSTAQPIVQVQEVYHDEDYYDIDLGADFEEWTIANMIATQEILESDCYLTDEEFDKLLERKTKAEILKHKRNEIIQFIQKHNKPVSREIIFSSIQNITPQIFSQVINSGEIIKYYKAYLHTSKFPSNKYDIAYLKTKVISATKDCEIHRISELYDALRRKDSDLLDSFYINDCNSLFLILDYLFHNDFNFSRPFFSKKGIPIQSIENRIISFIGTRNTVNIKELVEYTKQNGIIVPSWLKLLNSINNNMLFKDRLTMISLKSSGIDVALARNICGLVKQELDANDHPIPIRELSCIASFPPFKLPWDEWLIYSIINKWDFGIHVATTSPQLKLAIPVVSKSCITDSEQLKAIADHLYGTKYDSSNLIIHDFDDMIDDDEFDWEDLEIE